VLEMRLKAVENEQKEVQTKFDALRSVRGDETFSDNMRTFMQEEGVGTSTPMPQVDGEKIASSAVNLVMSELETIGLLVQVRSTFKFETLI